MKNKKTCEQCGKDFFAAMSDKEALKIVQDVFGEDLKGEDCVILCRECRRKSIDSFSRIFLEAINAVEFEGNAPSTITIQ